MKKKLIMILLGVLAYGFASAQEYKVAKASGRLVIKLPSVTVEGYEGKEVIFKSQNKQHADERAAGLRLLSGTGEIDNTGLGISVTEKAGNLEVNEVAQGIGRITIMVPKDVSVSYNCQSIIYTEKVILKQIKKEIEVSVRSNAVELEDVTGPVTINTVYGAVTAKFGEKITGPITISSMYANVDVAVPLATKANLKLNSTHGNVYAAADMKIELKKLKDGEMVAYSGNVAGTLNGGGTDFNLTSEFGKVYLRKAEK